MKNIKLIIIAALSAGLIILFNNCSGAFSANSSISNQASSVPLGIGAPSAPTQLELVNQGGPNNNNNWGGYVNSLSNFQAIEWQAANAGAFPIDHYQIYRNGIAYATVSAPTQFQGYISGNILTVTSVASGTIFEGPRWSGPGVAPGTLIDEPQLSGTPEGVGTYHVNITQTVGSSSAPVTFSAWIFADTNATGSIVPDYSAPATAIYSYSVSAVDTQGSEGPLTSNYSAYGYQNGYSNWSNDNFNYGSDLQFNWNSTNGNPLGGIFDMEADFTNTSGGGLNPVAAAPMVPTNDIEIGAFNYYTIDINPGPTVGYTLFLSHVSRLPPGDVYGWSHVPNIFAYGPVPKPNTWATYKIPLTVLGIGICDFTGSISGTTLTVTAVNSGPAIVQAGGFITGSGIPNGTYIVAQSQNSAIGAFTIAGPGISASTNVPSESMTYRRTDFYKSTIQASASPVTYYINNFGWTTN